MPTVSARHSARQVLIEMQVQGAGKVRRGVSLNTSLGLSEIVPAVEDAPIAITAMRRQLVGTDQPISALHS